MTKRVSNLFVALICMMMASTSASATSIFVSSMTLLSTKTVISHQRHEEECMALGLYHEARGEPVVGQYAVGATILNRVRSSAYPGSVCGVIFQNAHKRFRCQFSFACDDISNNPTNENSFLKMQRLAKTILKKGMAREAKFIGQHFQSSVDEITHYHRHDVSPVWSRDLKQISVLGAHVFFKSDRVTRRYKY